ncbi:unnamed protein product, partial [Nesidiocoris tenuis]
MNETRLLALSPREYKSGGTLAKSVGPTRLCFYSVTVFIRRPGVLDGIVFDHV